MTRSERRKVRFRGSRRCCARYIACGAVALRMARSSPSFSNGSFFQGCRLRLDGSSIGSSH